MSNPSQQLCEILMQLAASERSDFDTVLNALAHVIPIVMELDARMAKLEREALGDDEQ